MTTTALTKTTQEKSKSKLGPVPMYGIKSAKLSPDDKLSRIAETAYYKAQARGFESGHEMDDWLAAEKELSS